MTTTVRPPQQRGSPPLPDAAQRERPLGLPDGAWAALTTE